MNIAEQMKDVLKEEIKAAVLKAGLAEESQIPSVLLETPKEKHTVIIPQTWRCAWRESQKSAAPNR